MPVGTPQLNPAAALILSSVSPARAGPAAANPTASTAASAAPANRVVENMPTIAPLLDVAVPVLSAKRDFADANTAAVQPATRRGETQIPGRLPVAFHVADNAERHCRGIGALYDRPADHQIIRAVGDG